MPRLSLTARLTGWYVLASSVLLLGLAAFVFSVTARHFDELDRHTLHDKIALVQRLADSATSVEQLRHRLHDALHNHAGLYVRIEPPDGPPLYATADFAFPAALLRQHTRSSSNHAVLAWHDQHASYQGLVASLTVAALPANKLRIMAAIDTGHHTRFMADLRQALAWYVVVGVGISALLGWWAARAGLRPLHRMRAQAQQVTAQRLDQRMDVEAMPVELADLATSLNAMLQRLQHDFERLSDFSSDLAHELRTPLNNLLTQSEVVLSRPRGLEMYRDTLASQREELQRLSRTVSDMLWLAKADSGRFQLPHPDRIDLAQEVQALFDFYEALAEEQHLGLVLQGQAQVLGDRLMLRRAISNLLSNALRHATPGSEVVVQLHHLPAGEVRISVTNQGEPIPPELLPRLFDRFFRADKARVRLDTDGAGLGLSITQAIAQAHGGRVHASSLAAGNVFCIDLPSSPLKP
ncbi:MAG: heavy metal sensor histidine kinase [Macromonas bipunctata]|nr:heavy metal sensor histidine kinase [Macromonas bipunctata]